MLTQCKTIVGLIQIYIDSILKQLMTFKKWSCVSRNVSYIKNDNQIFEKLLNKYFKCI